MLAVADLLVMSVFILLCCVIGYIFRNREGESTNDYFLAGRRMYSLPAAFSIAVTFLSSATFTVYIGEIYIFGWPIYLMILATFICAPIILLVFQPKFYGSPHLSVFQFLEERFSPSVRYLNSAIFLITSVVALGIVGYATAIASEVLAGVPFWISALAVGLLSTAYSTLGGLKAVIWTDVVQALVMLGFLLVIIIKVCLSFDSAGEMWNLITSGKRISFSFAEGPTHRYSATSQLLSQCIYSLFSLCISQPGVQRWKSVGSLAQARRTAIFTMLISCCSLLIVYVTGLLVYAFYARCSFDRSSLPRRPDKISLHFVSTELSSWPGVIGLCLGGILSAALSTYSSYINSMAAVTLDDFLKWRFNSLSKRREILLAKALTAFYGLLVTGFIFVTAQLRVVVMIDVVNRAICFAPPLATFCLAIWCKRANTKGVITGTVVSTSFLIWLSVGSFLKGHRHKPLPLVNPLCPLNSSFDDQTLFNVSRHSPTQKESSFLEGLYSISFSWYPPIGLLSSVLLSYALSLLFSLNCFRKLESSKNEDGGCSEAAEPLKTLEGTGVHFRHDCDNHNDQVKG